MTDDLTPEGLRRANIKAMNAAQLDTEYAAVNSQPQSDQRDTYLSYLTDEYAHRGQKVPA